MTQLRSYTTIVQSKKLAEILPLESADMYYPNRIDVKYQGGLPIEFKQGNPLLSQEIAAWSLAALLGVIKDKCGYFEFVYLKRTYDGRANPLEDVYRLSTDVYDVYKKEALDACYDMIIKLKAQNLI